MILLASLGGALELYDFVVFGVFASAIGAAFLAANPLVGLAVPAALTPKAFLYVKGKFDPQIQAATKLEALL